MSQFFITNNVDECVKILTDHMTVCLDAQAPVKKYQVRKNQTPWVDEECKHLIEERNIARSIYQADMTVTNWRNYRTIRNKATNLIKNKKHKYKQERILSGNDPRMMWTNHEI